MCSHGQGGGDGDPLHAAGCMLYWAEGEKSRNQVRIANSDPHLLRFFVRFLKGCFNVETNDLVARVNCYTSPGQSVEAIEAYWSKALELPPSAFTKATVNHLPTSSSGKKRGKLPYGTCTLSAKRSTWMLQHIYGALEEYAGFEGPSGSASHQRRAAVAPRLR